jgi:hypothetical protein
VLFAGSGTKAPLLRQRRLLAADAHPGFDPLVYFILVPGDCSWTEFDTGRELAGSFQAPDRRIAIRDAT